jgi:ABC-type sulfate transport system permease component
MIQYRNNLIGKHFKTLMQIMAFHVHDLVSAKEFALIKAVGALGSLLWVHEIEDMNSYLVSHYIYHEFLPF